MTILATAATTFGLLGASVTNNVIVSSNILEKAWKRDVVMKNQSGEIFNDSNQVGEKSKVAAADIAADEAGEISKAAREAMEAALVSLEDAKKSMATNALALAFVVPPETTRSNLTAYVVKTETINGGLQDRQYVWFSHDVSLAPNRFVVYETYGQAMTNKVKWLNWKEAVDVTVNGRTWKGCKVCDVSRPTWAVGESCLDLPNDTFGGPNGMDFGDIVIRSEGITAFTGFVTNGITGEVAYFDNGFFKGFKKEEE